VHLVGLTIELWYLNQVVHTSTIPDYCAPQCSISSVVSEQPTLHDSTQPHIFQTNLITEGFNASAVKQLTK